MFKVQYSLRAGETDQFVPCTAAYPNMGNRKIALLQSLIAELGMFVGRPIRDMLHTVIYHPKTGSSVAVISFPPELSISLEGVVYLPPTQKFFGRVHIGANLNLLQPEESVETIEKIFFNCPISDLFLK